MESLSEEYIDELKVLYEKFRFQTKVPLKVNKENSDASLNSGDNQKKDENPIETQYASIFAKLDDILSKLVKDSENYLKVLAMKASLYYELSKISLNTNTVEKSKDFLEIGMNLIKAYEEQPLIAFLYMRIVNYNSYVLALLGDLNTARTLLESSNIENLKCTPVVYTTEELFCSKTINNQINAQSKINKIIINNMQMLGWIYGKLGLNDLYADLIHKSLQKELDSNEIDPVQWAIKSYRLASLFITQNKWKDACNHLAAAQTLLDPLEVKTSPNTLLFKAQADMARVWVSTI